jgi:hypothetical protein
MELWIPYIFHKGKRLEGGEISINSPVDRVCNSVDFARSQRPKVRTGQTIQVPHLFIYNSPYRNTCATITLSIKQASRSGVRPCDTTPSLPPHAQVSLAEKEKYPVWMVFWSAAQVAHMGVWSFGSIDCLRHCLPRYFASVGCTKSGLWCCCCYLARTRRYSFVSRYCTYDTRPRDVGCVWCVHVCVCVCVCVC